MPVCRENKMVRAIVQCAMLLLASWLVILFGESAWSDEVAEKPIANKEAESAMVSSAGEGDQSEEEEDLPPSVLMDEAARKKQEEEDGKHEWLLKAPEDFAPPERVVVGRDAREFRKAGTLLEQAGGNLAVVDQNQLANRRSAMYSGHLFTNSLAYPKRPKRVLKPVKAVTPAVQAEQTSSMWPKIVVLVIVLGLGGFYFIIRRGLLDRQDKRRKPRKKKEPRIKVTLTRP